MSALTFPDVYNKHRYILGTQKFNKLYTKTFSRFKTRVLTRVLQTQNTDRCGGVLCFQICEGETHNKNKYNDLHYLSWEEESMNFE